MRLELKDVFTLIVSITSLFISFYQLWDSRRKKLKIYFGSDIKDRDGMIMHFLFFQIINRGNRPLQVLSTNFYLYPIIKENVIYSLIHRISGNHIRVYFASAKGDLYNDRLDIDRPYKVQIEAYEIYSHYILNKRSVRAIKIEIIDLDGKKYQKRVHLNQLDHDQNNRLKLKQYCFPLRYFKYEDKIRRKRKRDQRKLQRNEVVSS